MPKTTSLTRTLPLRVDASTEANAERIIKSGLAADRSAALRASAAITARLLSDDPHIYMVQISGLPTCNIFGTRRAAEAWLDENRDEDSDYDIEPILPA